MVPPLTQSKALPPGDWVSGLLCPSPSSYFRLSHLVVLGFLPASRAISTQPGCSVPQTHGASPEALFWWSLGARGQVAFSLCLPWSSLLSGWCCPTPLSLGYICLFVVFFILMRLAQSLPPPPRPSPHTAVNLSVVINTAALLPASASAVSLIKRGGPSLP